MISLGRAVLASFFLLAFWLEGGNRAFATEAAYSVLASYLLFSLFMLILTWNNWWAECRLSAPAHVVDVLVFCALIFATGGYISPFFTFFVFLILSATIRWGWHETAMTGVIVVLLYVAAGITAENWGTEEFDLRRFIIRSSYLIVLSMIVMWFGTNQRALQAEMQGPDEIGPGERDNRLPVREAMEHVSQRFSSNRIVFAWWETEEPWINIATLEHGTFKEERLPPCALGQILDPAFSREPLLFDTQRGRVLVRRGNRRVMLCCKSPIDPEFVGRFGVRNGLVVRLPEDSIGGDMFVLDVPALCSDDLKIAEGLGAHVAAAFERMALLDMTQEAAATRARLALARDLHDSVVQFLAGMAFRLEGVRKSARDPEQLNSGIDALQQELSAEQRDLRGFILQLRGGRAMARLSDLSADLNDLIERTAGRWGIECTFRSDPPRIDASAQLQHNVHQLVREAIANAVRHGKATGVRISLTRADTGLVLDLSDNGSGFPGRVDPEGGEAGGPPGPWSLHERVQSLGGSLMLHSTGSGSRVSITVPMAAAT